MVRVYYTGTGPLNMPELAGLHNIPWGHAVDMPRALATRLVAEGLFARTCPPGPKPSNAAFAEIASGGNGATLMEIAGQPGRRREEPVRLMVGQIHRLGTAKLALLSQAGIYYLHELAGLSDEWIGELAEAPGLTTELLFMWRDVAQQLLARQS
jgi:hypothetical protein